MKKTNAKLTPLAVVALYLAIHSGTAISSTLFVLSQEEPKTVLVRGKESIVQELTMGPDATELWVKIQQLVANIEVIPDFQHLVQFFGLSVSNSAEKIYPSKPGYVWRSDLEMEKYDYLVKHIVYRIGKDPYQNQKRVAALSLDFYPENICISSSEVRRVFGKGVIGVSVHSAVNPSSGPDTAGMFFSESYGEEIQFVRRSPLVFEYGPSGCVRVVTVRQQVAE